MDSSLHVSANTSDVHMVINTTNISLACADYVPGRFLPHSLCFGNITQRETYYIILVSARDLSLLVHHSQTVFIKACLISLSLSYAFSLALGRSSNSRNQNIFNFWQTQWETLVSYKYYSNACWLLWGSFSALRIQLMDL